MKTIETKVLTVLINFDDAVVVMQTRIMPSSIGYISLN